MSVNVYVQLSSGRYPVTLNVGDSLHLVRTHIRNVVPEINHVNLKDFRFNVNGVFLTDDSKTVQGSGITDGQTLVLVRKTSCPNAGLDTEKKADE